MVNILFPGASQLLSVTSPLTLLFFSSGGIKFLISASIYHSMLSASRVCHIAPRKGKRYLQRPQEAPGDHVLVPHRLTRQRRQQWLHSLCVVRSSLKPQTVPEKKLEMSWEDRISENSLNCIMYMNPQLGMCKSWNMWCLRLCPVQ